MQRRVGIVCGFAVAAFLMAAAPGIAARVDSLEEDGWIQGSTSLAKGDATLVVFWELWCGYCRKSLPEVEHLHRTYRSSGLNVVGMSRVNGGVNEEQMRSFARESGISFPLARASKLADRLGITGVPSAALIHGGKVVWQGHPSKLDEETVRRWL